MVFSASPLVVLTISSIWKWCRPILFWEFGIIMPISSIWKRDFLFLGLWWEPLENNANIFSLKTGFQLFFLACDGNLWKNNINIFYLKTEFPYFFLGLWWEPHLKTGFPCLFGLFWIIMPISSIWKRDFPFLGLWWEPLEKQCQYLLFKNGISVVFIWLVMATSGK